ncbi:MAG: ABC transporter ATP-binding protein, partial [Anaerolineae bacterium]|nr:ABC transporter ATP-binding protein [Anaerolineae bacterium]
MSHRAGSEALARVEDLVVRRGTRTVLQVPLLDVKRGESLAVIGPNGAGKSTLLLALALLVPPSQGRVWFEGEPVTRATDLTRLRRRMAVVFQEPLLVDQSVFDNVALGLRLHGLRGAEVEQRVKTWLDRLGIAHLARRSARGLSGGEAQRTSLARAFALQPDLLLLDEPFAALDAPTRAGLVDQVGGIVRDMGLTTVVVTHDRDEALTLGDRLAVLINGRLAQVGPPDEVFSAPADEP